MKTTTKEQRTHMGILLLALRDAGADSFLVNVIGLHHSKPYRKLRGLLNLVKAGHELRTAQFDLDVLVMDGERKDWAVLEAA